MTAEDVAAEGVVAKGVADEFSIWGTFLFMMSERASLWVSDVRL